MSNINDMIVAARNSQPRNFEKAFSSELSERVNQAIKDRKAQVLGEAFGWLDPLHEEDDDEKKNDDDDDEDNNEDDENEED